MIRLNCKTSCTPNHEQNTWSRIQVVSCIKIFFAAYVLCMDRRHRKCSLTLKPLELGLCVSWPGCSWTCAPSAFFLIFGSSFFFCLLLFLFFFSSSLFLPNRRSTFPGGRAIGIENLGMAITSIIYASIFQTLPVILALNNSTSLSFVCVGSSVSDT